MHDNIETQFHLSKIRKKAEPYSYCLKIICYSLNVESMVSFVLFSYESISHDIDKAKVKYNFPW